MFLISIYQNHWEIFNPIIKNFFAHIFIKIFPRNSYYFPERVIKDIEKHSPDLPFFLNRIELLLKKYFYA